MIQGTSQERFIDLISRYYEYAENITKAKELNDENNQIISKIQIISKMALISDRYSSTAARLSPDEAREIRHLVDLQIKNASKISELKYQCNDLREQIKEYEHITIKIDNAFNNAIYSEMQPSNNNVVIKSIISVLSPLIAQYTKLLDESIPKRNIHGYEVTDVLLSFAFNKNLEISEKKEFPTGILHPINNKVVQGINAERKNAQDVIKILVKENIIPHEKINEFLKQPGVTLNESGIEVKNFLDNERDKPDSALNQITTKEQINSDIRTR